MIPRTDIQAFCDRIAKEFHPKRVILFGSYAHGSPTPDSDVDLLVEIPFSGKGWQMASQIRSRISSSFPLDLLVRSPGTIRERLEMGDVFIRDIIEHGEVLYEADDR